MNKVELDFNERTAIMNRMVELAQIDFFDMPDGSYDERLAYSILKNKILPKIHAMAYSYNKERYMAYSGNLCRHCTFYSTYFLRKVLPKWRWDMKEMKFSAKLAGHYFETEHAYILGRKDGVNCVIDMWDKLMPQLWVSTYNEDYPELLRGVCTDKKVLLTKNLSYHEYMGLIEDDFMIGDGRPVLDMIDEFVSFYDAINYAGSLSPSMKESLGLPKYFEKIAKNNT